MRFLASEFAHAALGRLVGPDAHVDGATQDSRSVQPGQLFVPIVAERDGHEFIPQAFAAGAAATLSSRPAHALGHEGSGRAVIEVDDTLDALASLGRAARARLGDRVVGITGSVGKTSTKDLCAAVLRTRFVTAAAERSFNNEIGVPLTLLNAPEGAEAAVVEMGARGIGHIAALASIAQPTVGIVTCVGAGAHLELFGTLAKVAEGKGELIESLPAHGTAVLNADDPLVRAMASRASANVVTFGEDGDVRALDVELDDGARARFRLCTPWGEVDVALRVAGRHMVANAAAAATAALACGLDIEAVAEGLATATLSPWRMELARSRAGAVVINDAYNANPMSMTAALDSLRHLARARAVAVLGLMAELGDSTVEAHRAVAEEATRHGVELIAVGTDLYGVEPRSLEEAYALLGSLGEGDAVLVKGSRVAGLEALAARLLDGGHEAVTSSQRRP
ncbi:MAG: UDP-N-acetylmuramoyl-tripeptide--D-alanyl-D-alanine ligase [Acidimicrobiia bacterium]|nr:UDP-N-acetylmuramoyl-tripeptide--D-alanyl-D-alanine ligase [Acidimicrobiia bacterium]